MKKFTKLSVLILALIMICLCFCSCSKIDEMRKEHAVWTTKGSIESITLNGEEYILLPEYKEYFPEFNFDDLSEYYVSFLWITAPDVPVLLSNAAPDGHLYLSKDKSYIAGDIFNYPGHYRQLTRGEILHNLYSSPFEDNGHTLDSIEVFYYKADLYDELVKK